jgi:superfamily II DNA/RNA helicase
VYVGTESGKLMAIKNLLKKGFEPPILIFVQSKKRANDLFKELVLEKVNVDVISADRSQPDVMQLFITVCLNFTLQKSKEKSSSLK